MSVAEEWTEERIDALEHSYIGPTWQRGEDGKFILPERTIGWQVIAWCMRWLRNPNGNGRWTFTNEQARFFLWWFALDPQDRFRYRTGVFQRMKGTGKDYIAAVLCLVELVGPSLYSHDDEDGNPIGVANPNAFIQIAAVTQEQGQNTFSIFHAIVSDEMRAEYQLEVQAENLWAGGRRQRIQIVTSNPRALEGNRVTLAILNETQHWVLGNKGHSMFDVISMNIVKANQGRGRWLCITNAFMPGEDSVAERLRADYEELADKGIESSFLYDSIEADPATPMIPQVLAKVLEVIRGDSTWLDIPSIVESMMRRSISVARNRRMWLNSITAADDALIPDRVWSDLKVRGEELDPGDAICLGFDGSLTDDATALVAIRMRDRLLVPLGIWERGDPDYPDTINKAAVRSAVAAAFKTYKVRAFLADVALWESDVADWSASYREMLGYKAPGENAVAFDMRNQKRSTLANERMLTAVADGRIKHQGKETELSRRLWKHVMNLRRRQNRFGVSFGKETEDSPKKVDAYAAAILAHEAMHLYLAHKKEERPRTGLVYSAAGAF